MENKTYQTAHEYYVSLDEENQNTLKEQLLDAMYGECNYGNEIDLDSLTDGDDGDLQEFYEERLGICHAFKSIVDGTEPSVHALFYEGVVDSTIEEFKEEMKDED